jgi:hypothetical protein
MTFGEEIREKIHNTLRDGKKSGNPIVSCTALWERVRQEHTLHDPFYGRYKSVLGELIHTARIKLHRDEDGKPKGFELLERKH